MKLHLPPTLRSALLAVCVFTGLCYGPVAAGDETDPSTPSTGDTSDPGSTTDDGDDAPAHRDATTLQWTNGDGDWQAGAGEDHWSAAESVTDKNFYDGDTVEFTLDDEEVVTVTVVGEVSPAGITVNTGNDATLTIASGSEGVIAGEGSLTKKGLGTLELDGENTYAGGTILEEGTLKVLNAAAMGTGEVKFTGGELDLNGYEVNNAISVTGDVTISNGSKYQGVLTLNSGSISGDTLSLQQKAQLKEGTINNDLTGDSGFIKSGKNKLTLSGNVTLGGESEVQAGELVIEQTFEGTLAVKKGATLTLKEGSGSFTGDLGIESGSTINAADGLTAASGYTVTLKGGATINGAITVNGGTLSVQGLQELSGLTLSGGTLDLQQQYWLKINGALTLTDDTTTEIQLKASALKSRDRVEVIQADSIEGKGKVHFDILDGARADQGIDEEKACVWVELNAAELTWTNNSGGIWELGGSTEWMSEDTALADKTFHTLDDVTFVDAGDVDIKGEVNPGNIEVTVTDGNTTTFTSTSEDGKIIGEADLVKEGEGTLVIGTKNNTYTGSVVVNGGTLEMADDSSLGAASITINDGATFKGGNNDFSKNELIFNGNSTFEGIGTISNITFDSGATITGDRITLGSKSVLTVAGDGSTYTGDFVFAGGGTVSFEKDGTLVFTNPVTFESTTSTTSIYLTTEIQYSTTYTLMDFKDFENLEGIDDVSQLFKLQFQDQEMADFATLYYSDGKLMLSMGRPPTPAEIAQTLPRNQRSAYWAIREIAARGGAAGTLGSYVNAIANSKKPNVVRELVSKLDGSELAAAMSSQIEGNMAHMRRLRTHIGTGQFLDPNEGTLAAYVKIFNDNHRLKTDSSGLGHKRMVTGGMFGIESQVRKTVMAGLSLSDGRARIKPNDREGTNYEDASHVDLYLSINPGNGWQSVTTLGAGFHSFTFTRSIAEKVNAELNDLGGFSVNFSQEVAYTFSHSENTSSKVFFSILSSFNKIDAFEEEGADTASLVGDSRRAWATDLTLGVRFTRAFPVVYNQPEATFSMQTGLVASIGNTTADLNMHFLGAPDVGFTILDAETKRWGYNVAADVVVPVAPGAAVSASVGAVLRGGSHEVSASMGVWFSF